MLRDIRQHARVSGLKIVSADSSFQRRFGFETDCSEFSPKFRRWSISIGDASRTAKSFDCFLDGERVTHPEQEEIMWRYLRLLRVPRYRATIAECLTTGSHPPPTHEAMVA